jgi:hypothetical protein
MATRIKQTTIPHLIGMLWIGLAVLYRGPAAADTTGDDASGYARSDGVNSVVYRGQDNHIHELYLGPGASWQAGDLTAITGAALAAGDARGYARSDGVNSVVYRDVDGHVHELRLILNTWHDGDLTAQTGAPI